MRYSPLLALGLDLRNFPRRHNHVGGTVGTTTNTTVIVTLIILLLKTTMCRRRAATQNLWTYSMKYKIKYTTAKQ
jgi:hypothetical protein